MSHVHVLLLNTILFKQNHKTNKKCTKMTCVFEKTSFISTPPSTSIFQMFKHKQKSQHDYHKKKFTPINLSSL
jgi:hypothetical protein